MSEEKPVQGKDGVVKEKLFTESKEEIRVFTNLTDCILVLSDLGIRGGQQNAILKPETLLPKESKDLGKMYSDEELKKSKSLREFFSRGMIMEGRPGPDFKWPVTPGMLLKERAKISNEFQDPTHNVYDDRLKAVQEKQKKEDEESKRLV